MAYTETDGHKVVVGSIENLVDIFYDISTNTLIIDPSNVSDTNFNVEFVHGGTGWVLMRSDVNGATNGSLAFNKQITTDTTAGALTMTVAMFRAGILNRDPNGAARTDTTPTAAELVADIPNAVVGTSYWMTIDNQGAATEDITLAGGTDVTMNGTLVIGDTKAVNILVTFTVVTVGSEAVTMYVMGDKA